MIAELLCAILGISLGSFLTVCVERLPKGESLIHRRSHCSRCQTKLHFYELIPIVSFIRQRGRCRSCHERISLLYPTLELISAIIVVWSVLEFGLGLEALQKIMLLLLLLVIAVIDARHFLIPDVLVGFGAVTYLFLQLFLHPSRIPSALGDSVASGGIVYLVYLAGNFLFKKKTMGMGDIKLSAALGLILGLKLFFFSFWIACTLGAIYGLMRIIVSNVPKDTKIPFGTMLAISSGLIILFPDTFTYFLDAWLHLN
jgi:prepilin signal peptidase PulO-like enzyme (type II secretory pathway)